MGLSPQNQPAPIPLLLKNETEKQTSEGVEGIVLQNAHKLLQVWPWLRKMNFLKNNHLFSIYFFDLPCWKNKIGSTIS